MRNFPARKKNISQPWPSEVFLIIFTTLRDVQANSLLVISSSKFSSHSADIAAGGNERLIHEIRERERRGTSTATSQNCRIQMPHNPPSRPINFIPTCCWSPLDFSPLLSGKIHIYTLEKQLTPHHLTPGWWIARERGANEKKENSNDVGNFSIHLINWKFLPTVMRRVARREREREKARANRDNDSENFLHE